MVDAGSWKGRKAIARGEQEYDPDFVRRAPAPYSQHVYDGAAGAYYSMPQYAQQQVPMQYNAAPYYANPGYPGYPGYPAPQYNPAMAMPPQYAYEDHNASAHQLERKS